MAGSMAIVKQKKANTMETYNLDYQAHADQIVWKAIKRDMALVWMPLTGFAWGGLVLLAVMIG
jgi:hypothetical protein